MKSRYIFLSSTTDQCYLIMCLTIVAPPTGVLRLGMTIHCPVLGQYLSTVYVCRNCFIKQWQCLVIILQRIINNDVYEVLNPSSFYKYLIGISQVSPIPTRKATYEDVFSSHCTSREPSRAYSRLQLLPAVLSHIIYLHSLEGSSIVWGLGYERGLGAGPLRGSTHLATIDPTQRLYWGLQFMPPILSYIIVISLHCLVSIFWL